MDELCGLEAIGPYIEGTAWYLRLQKYILQKT